jgi:hypothetical protein
MDVLGCNDAQIARASQDSRVSSGEERFKCGLMLGPDGSGMLLAASTRLQGIRCRDRTCPPMTSELGSSQAFEQQLVCGASQPAWPAVLSAGLLQFSARSLIRIATLHTFVPEQDGVRCVGVTGFLLCCTRSRFSACRTRAFLLGRRPALGASQPTGPAVANKIVCALQTFLLDEQTCDSMSSTVLFSLPTTPFRRMLWTHHIIS